MRKNGPFQDFFCVLGLVGRSADRGELGILVVVGEAGRLLTRGGSLGVGL